MKANENVVQHLQVENFTVSRGWMNFSSYTKLSISGVVGNLQISPNFRSYFEALVSNFRERKRKYNRKGVEGRFHIPAHLETFISHF